MFFSEIYSIRSKIVREFHWSGNAGKLPSVASEQFALFVLFPQLIYVAFAWKQLGLKHLVKVSAGIVLKYFIRYNECGWVDRHFSLIYRQMPLIHCIRGDCSRKFHAPLFIHFVHYSCTYSSYFYFSFVPRSCPFLGTDKEWRNNVVLSHSVSVFDSLLASLLFRLFFYSLFFRRAFDG